MSGEPNASACPVCGQSDQSQPVQAIVASQTTHTSNHGTSAGMGFANGYVVPITAFHQSSSTAQSPLAQGLDLPYPQQPPNNKANRGKLLLAVGWVMVGMSLLAAPGLASSAETETTVVETWHIVIGALILFSPIFIGGNRLIAEHQRDLKEWHRQIDLWQQARRVWLTLRYCHRDHVVYQWPDITISPTMVRQFAYDQIEKQPGVSGPQRA